MVSPLWGGQAGIILRPGGLSVNAVSGCATSSPVTAEGYGLEEWAFTRENRGLGRQLG